MMEDSDMKRQEFLSLIGNPEEMRAEADRLDAEAQALWDTIRDDYFTKGGKKRKQQPEPWSEKGKIRRLWMDLGGLAAIIRREAGKLDRVYKDPWSHIRSEELRMFGFEDAAAVVDKARERLGEHGSNEEFVAEAETGPSFRAEEVKSLST
jgi:hypothetical protein